MSVKITTKENQASGSFAGGVILENKPIGFPQDRGQQKPYSNIFYWANAWSDKGGLIGEHPHKMFEIMSFILDFTGTIWSLFAVKMIPILLLGYIILKIQRK